MFHGCDIHYKDHAQYVLCDCGLSLREIRNFSSSGFVLECESSNITVLPLYSCRVLFLNNLICAIETLAGALHIALDKHEFIPNTVGIKTAVRVQTFLLLASVFEVLHQNETCTPITTVIQCVTTATGTY